jgi:4-amino-4-deoxy-L-arabinose transferase-like glycosyltransferase
MNYNKLFLFAGASFFFLICYFPIFHHIDQLPLQIYDESRLAISAMEMLENGNYLIPYFNGEPDMWSTKPPLMIWLQAICIKIFGLSELAIRLPASIATLATVLMLFFFCYKYLENKTLGLIASLILITSLGYIKNHVSRTGDYDALVIFFNTASMLLFYLFVREEDKRKKNKYLYLMSLCVVLGVYTKSIVGLMFLPAFFLYLLWKKEVLVILKKKELYYSILGALFLIIGYYLLRESYNSGYIEAVYQNELGGRFLSTLENHKAPFSWYMDKIVDYNFFPWVYLLPISIFLCLRKKGELRDFSILLLLVIVTFLLAISKGQTKLNWYDSPIYPAMSILAAFSLSEFFRVLDIKYQYKMGLILIIFIFPYYKVIKTTYLPKPLYPQNEYGLFMRKIESPKKYYVSQIGYNSHILFYKRMYNQRGYEIKTIYPKSLNKGDTVLLCEKRSIEIVDSIFTYNLLIENRGCKFVEIISKN